MNISLKKYIDKVFKNKYGSYITEAAISLPVLIICVCALILIIKIVTICEAICFNTVWEVRDAGLAAYNKVTNVSLCKKIEDRVLACDSSLTDFEITKYRYLYSRDGIDDLISLDAKATFNVVNAVGINGRIEFEENVLARGFTGTLRDENPIDEEQFKDRQKAKSVVVFPRYGVRFHIKECRYVKIYDEEGSYKLVMDKKDAELKGFTPCLVCGGAANA